MESETESEQSFKEYVLSTATTMDHYSYCNLSTETQP